VLKSETVHAQPSVYSIKMNKFIRFIKVGYFLHMMALTGIFLFFIGISKIFGWFENPHNFLYLIVYFLIMIQGFTLPFFAELDALGRYQNYKQAKEKLFTLGYDERLIKPFMYSKCQRDAVIIAAEDLNCKSEVKKYYYRNGYRWYHVFPDAFVKTPLVLFKKIFWTKILFVKHYQLKNFYW
jgi:hypothetical protein